MTIETAVVITVAILIWGCVVTGMIWGGQK